MTRYEQALDALRTTWSAAVADAAWTIIVLEHNAEYDADAVPLRIRRLYQAAKRRTRQIEQASRVYFLKDANTYLGRKRIRRLTGVDVPTPVPSL